MKKALYLFAAAALLLQACSSNKSFTKKRYGHLKWIDHDTEVEVPGKDPKAGAPAGKTTRFDKAEEITSTIEKQQETFVQVETSSQVTTTHQPVTQSFPASESFQKTDQPMNEDSDREVKNMAETPETIIGSEQETSLKNYSTEPMMDDTAKLIICVILALFIPPLAMYLWDQNTDIWFVLDLILFLLILFLFFGYGFGLAGLLAVVIALLRIFELL